MKENKQVARPKPKAPSAENVRKFKLELLVEAHNQILVVVFFLSAFTLVYFFRTTLITLLEATKLFAIIGLAGFFSLYFLRKKLGLGILDGLYYPTFGIAPLGMALFFWINARCSDTYTETYATVGHELEGDGFTFELENGAYEEFWRIRNMPSEFNYIGHPSVTFTFCDGVFGYKVLKHRELNSR